MHYWRLDPDDWRAALVETKKLGVRFIDTYVPWAVHEIGPGEADFGEKDPRLDVASFLRLVHELGLYAIVRPGPHINAELTYFGIPERVIWDPECQARSPRRQPGDAAHRAGRLSGAELRQRSIPRRGRANGSRW